MNKLPKEITVIIQKTPQGLWAKVKEFPHCYTQAKDFLELIYMLNDAIHSHFGISGKDRRGCLYLPKALVEELKRQEWEKFFEQLRKKQSIKNRVAEKYTFANCPA